MKFRVLIALLIALVVCSLAGSARATIDTPPPPGVHYVSLPYVEVQQSYCTAVQHHSAVKIKLPTRKHVTFWVSSSQRTIVAILDDDTDTVDFQWHLLDRQWTDITDNTTKATLSIDPLPACDPVAVGPVKVIQPTCRRHAFVELPPISPQLDYDSYGPFRPGATAHVEAFAYSGSVIARVPRGWHRNNLTMITRDVTFRQVHC